MTIYDLDTLTLANVGEEITDDNRTAHAGLFLKAYNDAYFHICSTVLKPEATEAVQLDGDRRFDPAALSHPVAPGGILAVKSGLDYAGGTGGPAHVHSHYRSDDGLVAVPGAEAGAQVFVTYRRKPPALANDTPIVAGSGSAPELMPEEHQAALACYAAAAFFRVRRKFERMQVWMDAWAEAVQALRGWQPHVGLRLHGAYRPMP